MFNFPMVRRNDSNNLLSIDNLFDDLFKGSLGFRLGEFETLPAVDIYEKGDKITVKAEIPGVKAEDLSLTVDNDLLTISGEKKQENEVKEQDYYRLESAYGRFERSVRLPEAVKADSAKASYKQGVLRVELTKSADTSKKRIKIEVN